MKPVVTIFGVFGLIDWIGLGLFQIFGVIERGYYVETSIGFLAACVCFSALAIIEEMRPGDAVTRPEAGTFSTNGTVKK